jgi:hypothetical protein
MKKSDLLRALQTEIRRHTFDTFLDEKPSMAQGGKGVVVPGARHGARFGVLNVIVRGNSPGGPGPRRPSASP